MVYIVAQLSTALVIIFVAHQISEENGAIIVNTFPRTNADQIIRISCFFIPINSAEIERIKLYHNKI